MYVLWCQKDKVSCFVFHRCVCCLFVNNPTDPVHLRTDPNLIPASSTETQHSTHTHSLLLHTSIFQPFMVFVFLCGCSYDTGAIWRCRLDVSHPPDTLSCCATHSKVISPGKPGTMQVCLFLNATIKFYGNDS